VPDDPAPEPAPQLRVEPESRTTTETVTEVTKRPAEPTDDLVTTSRTLRIGRRTLHYTADAGRLVLRDERCEDGVFSGFRPKAEISATTYTLGRRQARAAAGRLGVQGGSRLPQRLAAPRICSGRAGPAPDE
jgi:hypothetical protein